MNDLLTRVRHEASCLAIIGTITLPAELHHALVAEVRELRLVAYRESCANCDLVDSCECAWDHYNIGAVNRIDCLAAK